VNGLPLRGAVSRQLDRVIGTRAVAGGGAGEGGRVLGGVAWVRDMIKGSEQLSLLRVPRLDMLAQTPCARPNRCAWVRGVRGVKGVKWVPHRTPASRWCWFADCVCMHAGV
jgi:hypothetical protein